VVGLMTLISRVLGFVRDMMFAQIFGVGAATDAFFVAFKIPNFMRRLFAEGAFSQAFVPVLSEVRETGSHTNVTDFVDRVAGTLGGILTVVTIVGVLAAPVLIAIFAPGFVGDEQKYLLAVDMLRLTFPYLLFISLTALAGGILNTFGRFAVPAFTPVFLNLVLIAASLWLAPQMDEPVVALAWGVLVAGIVQLLFQFPFLRQIHLLPRPRWGWHDSGVRKILRLMGPALFGVSVTQINLLIDTLIASFLVTGSVTWLYYSDRLVEFPLGLFGVALATVILPGLSKKHAEASSEAFSDTLDWALRWVSLIVPAAMVGLFLLSAPILTTLFQYDQFTEHDVVMSARSLMAYTLGLAGFVLIKILATGFFARQDTRTPVRIAVIAMLCNLILNLILVVPLAHAGLALATALAATVNASLLYRALRRQGVYRPRPGWGRLALQVMFANAVLAATLITLAAPVQVWFEWSGWERGTELLLCVGAGLLVYVASLLLVGIRPRQFMGSH
jgi:putative peptidoglycan lipid II flippase